MQSHEKYKTLSHLKNYQINQVTFHENVERVF